MVREHAEPRAAAKWLINEVLGRLNKEGLQIEEVPVSAQANSAILYFVASGEISGKIAKDVLDGVWTANARSSTLRMYDTRADLQLYIDQHGFKQVTDTGAIEAAVDAVIAANPDKVEAVKAKPTMLGWFVGQVMKSTGGKANPQAVNELLRKKLGV
jgi:aspartyl-tRNA(Asn)/glutamyl-tRNA(Gln) amidotransferase subunit B